MLTFEFTGVSGSMTEKERLTSGMVGKQVKILLSEEWEDLTCTAVFVAGDICRTAKYAGEALTIPSDVLVYPFRKLLVGVFGTNSSGSLVLPTILAEGPFVEIGADPSTDPGTVDVPVWQSLQEQIGRLSDLNTQAKSSLVAAINELAAGGSGSTGSTGSSGTTASGQNGLSIFSVNATITSDGLINMIEVVPNSIHSYGRTVQEGDFLITSNGKLAQVTDVTNLKITAEYVMDIQPQRGTDYWTDADIATIKSYVDDAILNGSW